MACGMRAAGHDQQFQGVVEGGRIAAAGLNDGEELFDVGAEERRCQDALAGVHPVDVAAQRVDFAVVRDVAVRVRQLPGGKGVGGEALVHQAQRAHHIGVAQLGVEIGDLRGQQQAFINDGAGRERRDVEEVLVGDVGRADFGLGALAHHVELALELVFAHAARAARRRSARCTAARRAPRGRWPSRRWACRASPAR